MNSDEALGRYQLYESGMVEMPEAWKAGIDPETFGRKVREQDNGYFTHKGYEKVCPPQLNTAETVSYTWEAAKAHREVTADQGNQAPLTGWQEGYILLCQAAAHRRLGE